MKKQLLLLLSLLALSIIAYPGYNSIQDNHKKKKGIIVVANKSGHNVHLINARSGKIVKELPTGYAPHEVEVSDEGNWAVVSNYGDREKPGNTLSVYNLKSQSLDKTIDLGEHTHPHGIDWIKGTNKLLVTTEGNKTVLVVDVVEGEIDQTWKTDQEISHMVVAAPTANRAFVSSIKTGDVTVFDLSTGKIEKQIHSGKGAEGLDVSPDGKELWVTNRGENTITIFNTQTLAKIEKIDCGAFPIRAKFSPDGKYFVVSNAESGHVNVFNANSRELVKRIKLRPPVPEGKNKERYFADFEGSSVPIGLIVPDNQTAYVANTHADVVTVIDLKELAIVEHLEAGKEPDGINFSSVISE